jgi:uncharacterized membrane protein
LHCKFISEKVCKQDKKFDGQTFYNTGLQAVTKWGVFNTAQKQKFDTSVFFTCFITIRGVEMY